MPVFVTEGELDMNFLVFFSNFSGQVFFSFVNAWLSFFQWKRRILLFCICFQNCFHTF